MADFRKWLFALAVVALLAGLTVPASASVPRNVGGMDITTAAALLELHRTDAVPKLIEETNLATPNPTTCITVNAPINLEPTTGLGEVGDIKLACTGGQNAAGQVDARVVARIAAAAMARYARYVREAGPAEIASMLMDRNQRSILFSYVTQAPGYEIGIAVATISSDHPVFFADPPPIPLLNPGHAPIDDPFPVFFRHGESVARLRVVFLVEVSII